MKVNNYIKVLSTLLIMFGHGSNNCEAQDKFERINVPIHRTNSINYSTSNINSDDDDNALIRSKSLKINNRKKNDSQLKRRNALKKSAIQKISFNNQIDGLQTEIGKYIGQINNQLTELFVKPLGQSIPDKNKLLSLKKIKGIFHKKSEPTVTIDINKLNQFHEYNKSLMEYLNKFYASLNDNESNIDYTQSRNDLINFCRKYYRVYNTTFLRENIQSNENEFYNFGELIMSTLTFVENCPEQLSNNVQIRMLIEQITMFQGNIYRNIQSIKDQRDMQGKQKIQTTLSECQNNLSSISKELIQELTKDSNITMKRDHIETLINKYKNCVSESCNIMNTMLQLGEDNIRNIEGRWNEKLKNIINNYYYTIQ